MIGAVMWHFFSFLASPKLFYQRIGQCTPWFGPFALFFLMTGTLWGLCFAPADYQQGDAFRLLYIHVPAAIFSMALYALMGVFSVSLLVWRVKLAGVLLRAIAPVGASMAVLALITGSLWGRPMWGTWWIWDARLTSELILCLLYLAILVLQQMYTHPLTGDKLIAILSLVGLIDLPIIHYSVYWWHTLHQGSTILAFAKPRIHSSMLYPLLLMMMGFLFYACYLISLKACQLVLVRERRAKWVRTLIEEQSI